MSNTSIKVENLSKQYRLGLVGTGTISHDLNRWWARVRGKEDPFLKIGETNDRSSKGESDYVWSLKDINFEVQQGEVLGIIGKNGAGKSTLLKILSKVTGPTTGRIMAKGRIGALLEVGTGFHPELTGRENVFLNGAILGMTKLEIKTKLDEIVDFSGCARYIDTPVKRYSSGMKVRLAFAVAAFLEPEILIVDEVLAVGDAEFQKKAIGKMQDVSKGEGRTVLFVSHNMAAVKNLCTRTIVLNNGTVDFMGNTDDAITHYLNSSEDASIESDLELRTDRTGNSNSKFVRAKLISESTNAENQCLSGDKVSFHLKIRSNEVTRNIHVVVILKSDQKVVVTTFHTRFKDFSIDNFDIGFHQIQLNVPSLNLAEGRYFVSLRLLYGSSSGAAGATLADHIDDAFYFDIVGGDFFGTGRKTIPKKHGHLLLDHEWRYE